MFFSNVDNIDNIALIESSGKITSYRELKKNVIDSK